MAFKAINNTAGLEGLVPTLLVFRAYPQIVKIDALLPLVIQRAAAIKKAIVEIWKLRAKRQIANALNMRNGPQTNAIYGLLPSSPILVQREGNTS